jgi:hypothetical protein
MCGGSPTAGTSSSFRSLPDNEFETHRRWRDWRAGDGFPGRGACRGRRNAAVARQPQAQPEHLVCLCRSVQKQAVIATSRSIVLSCSDVCRVTSNATRRASTPVNSLGRSMCGPVRGMILFSTGLGLGELVACAEQSRWPDTLGTRDNGSVAVASGLLQATSHTPGRGWRNRAWRFGLSRQRDLPGRWGGNPPGRSWGIWAPPTTLLAWTYAKPSRLSGHEPEASLPDG